MKSTIKLGEVVLSANTGADAIQKAPIVDYDTGIKCLRINDITNKRNFDCWGFCNINKNYYERFLIKKDDIFIARTGATIGVNKYIDKDLNSVFNNGLIRLRISLKKCIPKFIYYILQTDKFREHIASIAFGTAAQPNMKIKDLLRFEFQDMSIENQFIIVSILDSLDKKIELNNRMNDTLEGIAKALFKSWFIDFDPVRAKMGGREPEGLNPEIAALFPNKLVDSPLGEMPEGYIVDEIGNFLNCVGGGTPSTTQQIYWENGNINWATPKDLSTLSSNVLIDTERKITQAGLKKISSGLLPCGTVLLSSRAPIGYVAVAEVPVAINQGFIALKPNGILDTHYILHWVMHNLELIKSRANGSTFQEISKKSFRKILVYCPPKLLLEAFERIANTLHKKVIFNIRQNKKLSQLRSILLPKLISGELCVHDLNSKEMEII